MLILTTDIQDWKSHLIALQKAATETSIERMMTTAEQRFDKSVLEKYLRQHLKGFPTGDDEIDVQQFTTGISNFMYRVSKSDKRYVLRQRSTGTKFEWALQMNQEFKFLSTLDDMSAFPVPTPLLYCEDVSVMGREFYVMEYLEGRVFAYERFSGVSQNELRSMLESAVETMAKLHDLDWKELGLEFLGDGEDCLKKKVTHLAKQCKERNTSGELPSAENLINWLMTNVPDDGVKPVIVHSDYRADNIMFHPSEPKVLAVLDWEGVTLGHPFEDLAFFCIGYHMSLPVPMKVKALSESAPKPPEEDILNLYCKLRRMTSPPQYWTYFLALTFFKTACTLQELKIYMSKGFPLPEEAKQAAQLFEPFLNIASGLAGLETSHAREIRKEVDQRLIMSAEQSLDKSVLDKYLRKHLEGFPNGEEEVVIRQFTSGYSNLTFYLCKDGKEYVLRQKPTVVRFEKAHHIDKEFKILSALASSLPVPRPLLYCEDVSVIGTEFYVMEYIEGRVVTPQTASDLKKGDLRAMMESAVATMAKMHELNWEELGLEFLRDSEENVGKMVTRLSSQYKKNNTSGEFPSAENLINWLMTNVPDDGIKPGVAHLDFRLQNLLFHPTESQVLAVLDWEGAILGHPLLDLAYFCMAYYLPPAMKEALNIKKEYFSSDEDLVNLYCKLRGIPSPPQHWNYFLALNFFRLACLLQELKIYISKGYSLPDRAKRASGMVKPFMAVASGLAGLTSGHAQK